MGASGLLRITFTLLLFLSLCCSPLPIRAEQVPSRTIRVVMDNNYPPFAFLDDSGALKGITVDQWRLWEKKTGIGVNLTGLDWAEAQRRMQAGEFDVIDTMFRNEKREKIYDFTGPYAEIPVPLFFHADIAGIRGPEDVKGFMVAAKAGGNVLEVLKRHGVTGIIEFPSYEKIVEAARDGRIKVFTVDRPPALYYLNRMGIQDRFHETRPMYSGQFHRAVHKGDRELLQNVERGFAAITAAEYEVIEKRWYGSSLGGALNKKHLTYTVAGAGGIILLLLISNRILRHSVNRRTAELTASERRYRALVDNIPLGITLIDRDRRIVMVNRAHAELFGKPPEWFVGRHCYEEFERRDHTCAHCPGTVSLETGGVAVAETEGTRDDGSRIMVQIHTVPLSGKDGAPDSFIEVVENITERRRAQQAIENERTRLRALLHTIPDLVWLKDPEGVYLACNPRFEGFFGAREEDIVGRTDYDFVDAELADFFRANDRKAIEAGGPRINEEWVTFVGDGHRELLETIKTPMRDKDGNLIGVLGIARDITAMRLGEKKIRQQAELLELAQDSILVRDMESRLVYWNHGAEENYGWRREDVLGQVTHLLLKTEFPAPLAEIDELLLKHGAWEGELTHTRRDGTRIVVASRWVLKRDDKGNPAHILEINNNITERKRLEEELIRGQKLESLGVLAGGIAHDFNNILTGILGNISFSRMLVGDGHKAFQRLVECEKAAKRAAELTQQLLTFARGGEPVRKAIDTRRLIEESVSFALHGATVNAVLRCPPDIWQLDADAGQMSQVFNNLLINAKQAMQQGGSVTVTADNVEIPAGDPQQLEPGRYVRISLSDQGSGIAPEHLARIFDPYFTTKDQGSGLGLASVYSIVKRHGGVVSATSHLGKGSTFTLLVPAVREAVADASAPVNTGISAPAGSGRILVMDDEEMIRELLVSLLEELGYTVESCAEGSKAIALHAAALEQGNHFAAVILDLTVPGGMGGFEAARRIRERDLKVPLIVSSGYSADSTISDYLEHGFSGFVKKPYTLEELAEELARCIANT